MNTIMNIKDLTTLADIEAFLGGTQRVAFEVKSTKDERHQWVENVLKQYRHRQRGKRYRGRQKKRVPRRIPT